MVMAAADLNRAKAAQRRLLEQVGGNPDVKTIGVAPVGGGYELKVGLSKGAKPQVPDEVDGVPVRIARVGRVRKRTLEPGR